MRERRDPTQCGAVMAHIQKLHGRQEPDRVKVALNECRALRGTKVTFLHDWLRIWVGRMNIGTGHGFSSVVILAKQPYRKEGGQWWQNTKGSEEDGGVT